MRKGFDVFVRKYEVLQKPDYFKSITDKEFSGIKNFFYDSIVKDPEPN